MKKHAAICSSELPVLGRLRATPAGWQSEISTVARPGDSQHRKPLPHSGYVDDGIRAKTMCRIAGAEKTNGHVSLDLNLHADVHEKPQTVTFGAIPGPYQRST